jgi:penicillin-binding protein 2
MSRLLLPRLLILVIFITLVSRLYQLQLSEAADDRFRYANATRLTRYVTVPPIRGEIYASDGKTVLAETVPIFTVAVRPADLPVVGTRARTRLFAQLDTMLGISNTLTLSPSLALDQDPTLRNDLSQGVGQSLIDAARREDDPGTPELVISAPPTLIMTALRLSEVYSTNLTLDSPTAALVARTDIPGYQTLTIRSDIPHELALVLRENATSLPGVVVSQDYRRRYPLSGTIPSLSHVVGYIGRVSECELVRQNSARSWVAGMLESIGHAVECGIIEKEINPYELGIPRYLESDRIGKDGIEASYEAELRGELGIEAVVVDALGRPVRAPQVVNQVRNGESVALTIDVGLQQQVEQILRNWIDEGERRRKIVPDTFAYKRDYKPIIAGVAIVIEVRTGRILAMASWPSYDNNIWIDPSRAGELSTILSPPGDQLAEERRRTPLLNRAVAGQYPPGSTLKQFDAIVAMQDGVITPETKVRDPGRLVVQDQFVSTITYVYPNSSVRDNGEITVSDALKVSSNVFFMSVAGGNKDGVINLKPEEQTIERGIDIGRLADGLELFGFGRPTGVQIAGEAPGRVPTPAWKQRVQRSAWTTGDTYNVAIGQGNLEVTPLQLIAASAAIANNGLLYRPQIARAIVDQDGKVTREIAPDLVRRVTADPTYYQVVREGMRRSVTEGLNIAARDECSGLQIAGKTGTAEFGPNIEIPGRDGKGIVTVRQSHSWFVGFAPYDNPEIEVLVLSEGTGDLDNGSATITVPAVTQIMQAYFNVTPPSPLPRGCQAGLPPLPPRVDPNPVATVRPPLDQIDRMQPAP